MYKNCEINSDEENEEEEYEDKFFDNKELGNDIQISEEMMDRPSHDMLIWDENGASLPVVDRSTGSMKKKNSN